MQPYVGSIDSSLAESKQQSRDLFDTFSVGKLFSDFIWLRSHSFASSYAANPLFVGRFGDFRVFKQLFKKKIGREISI